MRALAAAALLWADVAGATLPDERLADPALEARAAAIGRELRCVVCQNQAIDESDAPLARDLRIIVREQVKAGASDAEAIDFVVERYGDFVLLKPPFRAETWLLWLGPFALAALGGAGALAWARSRRPAAGEAVLTADEQARLDALLRDDGV